MNKNFATNELLMFGTGVLIIGMILGYYSISTHKEVKMLEEKIDFEMVDNNIKLSTEGKYYKYAAYADFLTKKLDKNKNIPLKNTACIYLDYAQHNALKMYYLTNNTQFTDEAKKSYCASNIRTLYGLYDNYKTCKRESEYKSELDKIIKEIENSDKKNNENEERMTNFLGGNKAYQLDIPESSDSEQYSEELTSEQYEQLQQEQQLLQQNEPEKSHILVPIEQ